MPTNIEREPSVRYVEVEDAPRSPMIYRFNRKQTEPRLALTWASDRGWINVYETARKLGWEVRFIGPGSFGAMEYLLPL